MRRTRIWFLAASFCSRVTESWCQREWWTQKGRFVKDWRSYSLSCLWKRERRPCWQARRGDQHSHALATVLRFFIDPPMFLFSHGHEPHHILGDGSTTGEKWPPAMVQCCQSNGRSTGRTILVTGGGCIIAFGRRPRARSTRTMSVRIHGFWRTVAAELFAEGAELATAAMHADCKCTKCTKFKGPSGNVAATTWLLKRS